MEESLTDEFTQNISISDLRRFIEKINLNRERKVKLDLLCYEKVASALYYFLIEILHGVKMFTYGRIKRRNLSFSSTLNEQDAKAIKQIHSLGVPEGDVQIVRVMDVLNASEKKKHLFMHHTITEIHENTAEGIFKSGCKSINELVTSRTNYTNDKYVASQMANGVLTDNLIMSPLGKQHLLIALEEVAKLNNHFKRLLTTMGIKDARYKDVEAKDDEAKDGEGTTKSVPNILWQHPKVFEILDDTSVCKLSGVSLANHNLKCLQFGTWLTCDTRVYSYELPAVAWGRIVSFLSWGDKQKIFLYVLQSNDAKRPPERNLLTLTGNIIEKNNNAVVNKLMKINFRWNSPQGKVLLCSTTLPVKKSLIMLLESELKLRDLVRIEIAKEDLKDMWFDNTNLSYLLPQQRHENGNITIFDKSYKILKGLPVGNNNASKIYIRSIPLENADISANELDLIVVPGSKKEWGETVGLATFTVLKQVYPTMDISALAMEGLCEIASHYQTHIVQTALAIMKLEMPKMSNLQLLKNLDAYYIQKAVRIIFPGEIRKHANYNALNAIGNFYRDDENLHGFGVDNIRAAVNLKISSVDYELYNTEGKRIVHVQRETGTVQPTESWSDLSDLAFSIRCTSWCIWQISRTILGVTNEARILKELEKVEDQLGLAEETYNGNRTKENAAAVKYYEEKRDNILRRLQGGGIPIVEEIGDCPSKNNIEAGIYLSAVLEYISAELLELGGKSAENVKTITEQHIKYGIDNDAEFFDLMNYQITYTANCIPNIHSILINNIDTSIKKRDVLEEYSCQIAHKQKCIGIVIDNITMWCLARRAGIKYADIYAISTIFEKLVENAISSILDIAISYNNSNENDAIEMYAINNALASHPLFRKSVAGLQNQHFENGSDNINQIYPSQISKYDSYKITCKGKKWWLDDASNETDKTGSYEIKIENFDESMINDTQNGEETVSSFKTFCNVSVKGDDVPSRNDRYLLDKLPLRRIRYYQKFDGLITSFERFKNKVVQALHAKAPSKKMHGKAIVKLQIAIEAYLNGVLQAANLIAFHSNQSHVKPLHIESAVAMQLGQNESVEEWQHRNFETHKEEKSHAIVQLELLLNRVKALSENNEPPMSESDFLDALHNFCGIPSEHINDAKQYAESIRYHGFTIKDGFVQMEDIELINDHLNDDEQPIDDNFNINNKVIGLIEVDYAGNFNLCKARNELVHLEHDNTKALTYRLVHELCNSCVKSDFVEDAANDIFFQTQKSDVNRRWNCFEKSKFQKYIQYLCVKLDRSKFEGDPNTSEFLWEKPAIEGLQLIAESYLEKLLSAANAVSLMGNRDLIYPKDIEMARRLRFERS